MFLLIVVSFTSVISVSGGSNVVLGILGNSAFVECQLPISDTLIWQTGDGIVIAMNGRVMNENSTKYFIEKQNGLRESLVIHDLSLADDNIIKCFDLKNTSAVDSTKLSVLARPFKMNVMTSPPQPMLEGTEVTLTCEADGGKPLPNIQWFLRESNGSLMELTGNITDTSYLNGTGHRKHVLTVNVTRAMYRARFICNVTVPLLYHEMFTIDADVLLAPEEPIIRAENFDGSFDENSLLELACLSGGSRPTSSIYWLLDGHRLGDVEVLVKPDGNGTTSILSQVSKLMTKQYNGSVLTCAVTNKVLLDRGLPPRMANITLFMSYKPTVVVEQKIYSKKEANNVTLRCHIDAKPMPQTSQLYWTHQGAVVDRKYYVIANDSVTFDLVLNKVNRSDSGNYSCHAINRLGTSSSEPIRLQVQFAPVCVSGSVQKIAVKQGEITRINCSMYASPNNVTLTWRYRETDERIKTMAAITDMRNGDHVYGALEMTMGSQLRYAEIECYGNNTEGISTAPCVFEIVPPGPSQMPTNCSTSVEGNTVTVHCDPGFNGGSNQHFILQKLGSMGFETFLTREMSSFSFESRDNLTVRMCSFNDDYKNIRNCAGASSVVVENTGLDTMEHADGENSHRTAYIAGGVTAGIGALVIAIIVVLLLLRYRKEYQRRSRTSIGEKPCETQPKIKKVKEWLKSTFKSLRHSKQANIHARGNPAVGETNSSNRNHFITDIEDIEQPYQDVFVLASTPHKNLKTYRIDRNPSCTKFITEAEFDLTFREGTPEVPDILNASTGFALSPIVCRTKADGNELSNSNISINNNEQSVQYLDEVTQTHSNVHIVNDTTDPGISNCYNTGDIIDVLFETNTIQFSLDAVDKTNECFGVKTMHKEYTDGDIADILDSTEGKETTECSQNSEADKVNDRLSSKSDSNSTKNDDWISFDRTENLDHSDTILKFLNVDFSTEAIDADDYSKINNVSDNETDFSLENTGLYSSFLRRSFCVFNNKKSGCIVKSNSLPYRTPRRRQKFPNMVNRITDAEDDGRITSQEKGDCQRLGQSTKSFSSDRFSSDTASYSTSQDLGNKLVCSKTPSVVSEVTDASDTNCDIDEFTLTITSEATTEFDSKEWGLNTLESEPTCEDLSLGQTDVSETMCDINQCTLVLISETTENNTSEFSNKTSDFEANKQRITFHSVSNLGVPSDDDNVFTSTPQRELRRNSFLEAINNDLVKDDEQSDTTLLENQQESTLTCRSEFDSSFVNHGYEPDTGSRASDQNKNYFNSSNSRMSLDKGVSSAHHLSHEDNGDFVNVVAYF